MVTNHPVGFDKCDNIYFARCRKRLKEWGAPLEGWTCKEIIDVRDEDYDAPLSVCELCDCHKVRFEHVMTHEQYFEDVTVGCICAGIMEDDILLAKERERLMRNRSKRKKNFIKREWKTLGFNGYYRSYRGRPLRIVENNGLYTVYTAGAETSSYKGKPIVNFLSAMYAAFNLADPVEDIL